MKTLAVALMASAVMGISGAYAVHGGGNGGDDLELELKKRSLQIGYFVKSDMGSKVFKNLNPDALIEITNSMDIDVTANNVTDKYGTLRTCVNEPERSLITCNLARINALRGKKEDILTATLFHEILGLMELELGHQENVSMYPVSSKIIPYNSIVVSTPIEESQIRPEFYGLDSRGYGVTLVNKETNESLRLICLNNNVEIHRCRNYSIVRNANGMQAPLIASPVSFNGELLSQLKLSEVTPKEVTALSEKLTKLQENGFKWATVPSGRYGLGITRNFLYSDEFVEDGMVVMFHVVLPIAYPIYVVDTAVESGEQLINAVTFPLKALVSSIKSATLKSRIKKFNSKLSLVNNLLNVKKELPLIGTTKTVSSEDFNIVIEILTTVLQQPVNK